MLRPYRQPMIVATVEWKPQQKRHLAFTQHDAIRLICASVGACVTKGPVSELKSSMQLTLTVKNRIAGHAHFYGN